jgi:Uma2 family endonuclease
MEQPKKEYYTVEEYLTWDEDVRAELYEGTLIMLAQPTRRHQGVLVELVTQLHAFLKGKPCKVYPAPFGVRLSEKEDTIFEPDIVVVCDESKLGDRICVGAPDLVIEILSPSTARMDRILKFRKYREAGVREYWIVDPELNCVQVGILKNGEYIMYEYEDDESIRVSVLEGCTVNLVDVFAE